MRAVAYRMLGSITEADDAVQESWLHVSCADTSGVQNIGGWLTTVIAQICLDMLRSRKARREELLEEHMPETLAEETDEGDPEHGIIMADSVGLALLVALDTLEPAERLAFVLHDVFAMPFDEIAPIVERSPVAARQLASRARRRIQGAQADQDADLTHQKELVNAFLVASRSGNFDALVAALAPDVIFRSDYATVGIPHEAKGAAAVAKQFSGRAQDAQPALVNSAVGVVWAPGGQIRAVFAFTIVGEKIAAIEIITDPARVSQFEVTILDG